MTSYVAGHCDVTRISKGCHMTYWLDDLFIRRMCFRYKNNKAQNWVNLKNQTFFRCTYLGFFNLASFTRMSIIIRVMARASGWVISAWWWRRNGENSNSFHASLPQSTDTYILTPAPSSSLFGPHSVMIVVDEIGNFKQPFSGDWRWRLCAAVPFTREMGTILHYY